MFRNWTDSVGQVNHQLIVCIFFGFYFLVYFFFRVFRLWTYYIGYQFTSLNTQHLGSLFTKKNISDHFLLQNLNCLNVKRDIYSATFLIHQSIIVFVFHTENGFPQILNNKYTLLLTLIPIQLILAYQTMTFRKYKNANFSKRPQKRFWSIKTWDKCESYLCFLFSSAI